MGQVYLAEDMRVGGVKVAIKFLSQAMLNKKMRERFETEAKTSALLGQNSMHIVRVTDYGVTEEETPFYVMEYLRGESLSDIISDRPLLLDRFLSLARQICLGLERAHEGIHKDGKIIPIIHRDIKPSNILVSQDPTLGELVKILDFGIAKLLQEDAGVTNCFMGTLAYSSPEQMDGKELTSASDLYSLGVMMFQMLTGKMPLMAETHTFGAWYKAHKSQAPRSFQSVDTNLNLPQELEKLVMECLAKNPKSRPQSAREIINTLQVLEKASRPPSPPKSQPKSQSKSQPIEPEISKTPEDPQSQPIKQEVSKNPTVPEKSAQLMVVKPQQDVPGADEICQAQSWPKNKPLAQIVFPHLIKVGNQKLVTLWAMLSAREIEQRLVHKLYNKLYKNFLCSIAPHPMVLWLTVLYNQRQGPRWLPCYLDLKTATGQEMARQLGEIGRYRLLLFPLEGPHTCAEVMTISLNQEQCRRLLDWANKSRLLPESQPSLSKELLKLELEKLQPQILLKLESGDSGSFSLGSDRAAAAQQHRGKF